MQDKFLAARIEKGAQQTGLDQASLDQASLEQKRAQRKGFMIAAPSSNSGKTTITLSLLRALNRKNFKTHSFKAGPDYIDPKFHQAATGMPCYNLDPWGMRKSLLENLLQTADDQPFIVEAMMGLFDGVLSTKDEGANGEFLKGNFLKGEDLKGEFLKGEGLKGDASLSYKKSFLKQASPASLAKHFDLPIILVVDCAKTSHSIAALIHGFKTFDKAINLAGVILNRVGSPRHEEMLREAVAAIDVEIFGVIFRNEGLSLPDRHLGLVPAGEHPALDGFLNFAADVIEKSINMDAIQKLLIGNSAQNLTKSSEQNYKQIPPLGKHIAIAHDEAFCFTYPHLIKAWREAGVILSFFSPLNDEAPSIECDGIFLPGGYPELHCKILANAKHFKSSMKTHRDKGTLIYGECGGYMVLGEKIIDATGRSHPMLGLLPLTTSFEARKLHLGYRQLTPSSQNNIWLKKLWQNGFKKLTAHEFHYATIVEENCDKFLFETKDSQGKNLGQCGMAMDNVMGSFMHLIDGEDFG